MQQIICPKCKAQVDASLNFCPECGSILPLPNSSGLNQGERLTQVNQQHVAQAILNEGKKKQNPKTALAVGVITVLLIIVIFVILFATAGVSNNSNTASTTGDAVSVSSTLDSSEPESSVMAVVSEESSEMSAEESSEPVEESSEPIEESSESVEESSEEISEASAETVITVEKPDDWNNIYCYIYTKGNTMITNEEWPGEEMTETDGKYQYKLPEKFNGQECYVVFSATDRESTSKAQYPYSGYDGFNLSEKTDYTTADFEAYAEEFKANNT